MESRRNLNSLPFERNKLLAETDWVVIKEREGGSVSNSDWKTYRQALRDITDSATSLMMLHGWRNQNEYY